MTTVAAVALLHLCVSATAAASGSVSAETALTAEPGDVALLPCYAVAKVAPSLTTWTKDGREVARGGGGGGGSGGGGRPSPGPPAGTGRLALLPDGSLNIRQVTPGDEGAYLCDSTLPGGGTFRALVRLQVTSGPDNVSLSIGPAAALPNGTLVVHRGSNVSFNCSGASYPSQWLTWAFSGASSLNSSLALASSSGPWLDFRIEAIQPSAQGVYSCRAHNNVSHQDVNKSAELLVYYASDRHPECWWAPAQDPAHFMFSCTWFGAYPTPTLRWVDGEGGGGPHEMRPVYATEAADSLSVTLNRSLLHDGQTLMCAARHPVLAPGEEKRCSFTLKSPYPEGDPLVTALEATSVTLTCTEATSLPPANTSWRKGFRRDDVVPGSKYVLSQEGPTLKLTILNVSRGDEGVYFCRSENPVAASELEVYLTVRTSSAYTGAIVGVFVAALIVGSAAIIAKTVYSGRHRICLGGGFMQMEEDRGDVLSLVESDDEQIFQDAVPRLPTLTNGCQTTLVEIHRIPSSDHEDAETAETSPQRQGDSVQAEEPVDLVTF